jgi:hypothetical protein
LLISLKARWTSGWLSKSLYPSKWNEIDHAGALLQQISRSS